MTIENMFFSEGKNFTQSERKAFAKQDLIYNVTEDLLVEMEKHDISKTELARRLGKSRSFVTQVLNGARNMTLSSLSDIAFEIGLAPRIHFETKLPSTGLISAVVPKTVNNAMEPLHWHSEITKAKNCHKASNEKTIKIHGRPHTWENLEVA